MSTCSEVMRIYAQTLEDGVNLPNVIFFSEPNCQGVSWPTLIHLQNQPSHMSCYRSPDDTDYEQDRGNTICDLWSFTVDTWPEYSWVQSVYVPAGFDITPNGSLYSFTTADYSFGDRCCNKWSGNCPVTTFDGGLHSDNDYHGYTRNATIPPGDDGLTCPVEKIMDGFPRFAARELTSTTKL